MNVDWLSGTEFWLADGEPQEKVAVRRVLPRAVMAQVAYPPVYSVIGWEQPREVWLGFECHVALR